MDYLVCYFESINVNICFCRIKKQIIREKKKLRNFLVEYLIVQMNLSTKKGKWLAQDHTK